MSSYEWHHDGRRILIDLAILRPSPPTDLTSITVRALLDTGATVSGISRGTAESLGIRSMGKRPIVTANGVFQATRYLFRIGIPSDGPLPFVFDDLLGFELADTDSFQAVLGMDVLRQCDFRMRRDGGCSLVFA
jgi:predicted aspartyl protease